METPRVGNVYLFPTPDRARATAPQPDRKPQGRKIVSIIPRMVEKADAQAPDADALFTSAYEQEDAGAIEAAKALYQDLLRQHPDHLQGRVNLGRILHTAGDLHGALAHYDRALDVDHLSEVAGFNRAVAFEDLGWTRAAIRAYRSVLCRHPDCADAHYNVGRLLDLAGQHDEATKHLIRYRQLSKKDAG